MWSLKGSVQFCSGVVCWLLCFCIVLMFVSLGWKWNGLAVYGPGNSLVLLETSFNNRESFCIQVGAFLGFFGLLTAGWKLIRLGNRNQMLADSRYAQEVQKKNSAPLAKVAGK